MEVKPGYKNTEVGIIPNDWEVKDILKTSTLKARIGWQGLTVAEYLEDGDYYLITGTNFVGGRINWDSCYFVDNHRYSQDKNIQTQEDDILLTKDGTIGKIAYIDKLPRSATLNSGVFVIRPQNDNYVPLYLFYLFNSFYFRDFLNKLVAGSTINHLYQKDFILFNFPVPPTKAEQIAIATALSDADALIQSLEKLITKKRLIKQGAMQELLKPKEGWVVKKLGEVIKLQGGYAFKSNEFRKTGIPIVRISNIYNDIIDFEDVVFYEKFNIAKDFVINKGDILIAMSGATTGKIGVYDFDHYSYQNQRVGKFVVRDKNQTDSLFISHLIRSEKFKNNIYKQIAQGAQPNISGKQIESIEVDIPNLKVTQAEIAHILSDMDTEIKALESKLEKYKQIKQGMMQNLLTGKIRLV